MRNWFCGAVTALILALFTTAAPAEDLIAIEKDTAEAYATFLSMEFAKQKDLQVKVEAEPTAAAGLADGNEGIIIVPTKTLKEGEVDEAVDTEQGAGLGYLFLSPRFNPVVDGKLIKSDKLRTIEYGAGEKAICLLLSVRRVSDEDWRLYVYGADKKPLIDTKFDMATDETEGKLAITVKEAKGEKPTLTVTIFGKYAAKFQIDE